MVKTPKSRSFVWVSVSRERETLIDNEVRRRESSSERREKERCKLRRASVCRCQDERGRKKPFTSGILVSAKSANPKIQAGPDSGRAGAGNGDLRVDEQCSKPSEKSRRMGTTRFSGRNSRLPGSPAPSPRPGPALPRNPLVHTWVTRPKNKTPDAQTGSARLQRAPEGWMPNRCTCNLQPFLGPKPAKISARTRQGRFPSLMNLVIACILSVLLECSFGSAHSPDGSPDHNTGAEEPCNLRPV